MKCMLLSTSQGTRMIAFVRLKAQSDGRGLFGIITCHTAQNWRLKTINNSTYMIISLSKLYTIENTLDFNRFATASILD